VQTDIQPNSCVQKQPIAGAINTTPNEQTLHRERISEIDKK